MRISDCSLHVLSNTETNPEESFQNSRLEIKHRNLSLSADLCSIMNPSTANSQTPLDAEQEEHEFLDQ